jgi:hypothetical protein
LTATQIEPRQEEHGMRYLLALLFAACAPAPAPCPTPEGLADECPESVTASGALDGELPAGDVDLWTIANPSETEIVMSVGAFYRNEFGKIDCPPGFDIRMRAELAGGEVIAAPAASPPQCPIVAMRILAGEEAQLVVEGAGGVIPVRYVLNFSFE